MTNPNDPKPDPKTDEETSSVDCAEPAKPSARRKDMKTAWAMLGLLFLFGVVLQHILGGDAISGPGGTRIPFVTVGLAAFILTLAAGWSKSWHGFLASNRFSVPSILVLTILSVLGTMILQGEPEAALEVAYGGFRKVIQGLFLHDLFHSIGFVTVLGCSAGGMALTLVRKRKLTLRYAGAMGAHAGILLLLAGAAVGNVWVVKGRLNMHVGQQADSFVVPGADGRVLRYPLGFTIRLDDFRLEHYEPEYRLMVFDLSGAKEERLASIEPTSKEAGAKLADHGVELLDYWPDHLRETVVQPKPGGKGPTRALPAAVQLSYPAAGKEQRIWLFDEGRAQGAGHVIDHSRLVFFWDAERAKSLVEGLAAEGAQPTHVIKAGTERIPVQVGQTVDLPGSNLKIQVRRALVDFVMDAQTKQPANRSDKPNNPAIEIVIQDETGAEKSTKWLFAKFPAFHHEGEDSPTATLAYEYTGGKARSRPDWVVVGESKEWWKVANAAEGAKEPIVQTGPVRMGQTEVRLLVSHPAVERSFKDSSRSEKAENPVASVRVKTTGATRQLKPKKPVRLADKRVLVLAPKGGESVSDYLSTLSVWEDGKKILSETIEVNYPLEHKGFVFYQADYRPDDPTFSGFQVVRDSGLWLVYLGLVVNIAGVLVAVFLPTLRKRKRASPGAEGGAA